MTEIEDVLQFLTAKIIDYVKGAENDDVKVTKLFDPKKLQNELVKEFPIGTEGQGLPTFKKFTDFLLENSVATWNPRFLEKLYAGANPVGMASDMLLSVLNTNSHVFTASPALTVIEKYVGRKYAAMFGFPEETAGGLTFPGGSYSNITSLQIARSIMFPESKEHGVTEKLAVFASEHSHYSVSKAAILLGLGSASVYKVGVDAEGRMDVTDLVKKIEQSKADGRVPFYVTATSGTTVYGSFDPIDEIAAVTKPRNLWLHVDGSWGGNVVFSPTHAHNVRGSHLAQSITVNPHKLLGVPTTCSFLLLPQMSTFLKANSMAADYLFHGDDSNGDTFDLASGTMGCGRRPDALKLYTAWQFYGTTGFAARIDHAFEMTGYLSKLVAAHPDLVLQTASPPPFLQTCFFYAPQGKLRSASETSADTRRINDRLREDGKFLVDYNPDPEKGEFFRVVINSPNVTRPLLDELVDSIVSYGAK